MLEDFRDATPAELAAFFELGQFIFGDVEAVAKQLLEQGHDGENIANLAFDFDTSGLGRHESFQVALIEAGVPRVPTKKESIWIVCRYYLLKIERKPLKARDILGNIIDLEREYGAIGLFDRPDCDQYFAEQNKKFKYAANKYAAQHWGMENLFGLFYSLDDIQFDARKERLKYDEWLKDIKSTLNKNICQETAATISRFYSKDAELPIALKNVRELI